MGKQQRISLLLLVAVVGIMALLTGRAEGQCAMWSYDETGENGPTTWGDLCPDYTKCSAGLVQAPVDVRYEVLDYNMGPLSFDIMNPYSDEGTPAKTQVVSSQHSLRMDWAAGSTVTGGPFEHKVFYLTSLTFHAPSEFTFAGYRPDLSLYVYYHTSKKAVAVAVVSFNVSKTSNGFLDTIIPYVPINSSSSIIPVSIDLAGLITESFAEGYYTLAGSITSPPCTEDVTYVLARRVLPATIEQLSVFAALLHHNVRPVQPLNGRRIKSFVPFNTLDDGRLSKEAGWIFVAIVVGGILAVGLGSFIMGKAKKRNAPQPHPEELEFRTGN